VGNYNISVVQGSTLSLLLNITNSDGSAYNLSGFGVRSQVRSRYSSTGVLLDLMPTIFSVTGGIVQISGSATGISNLPVNDSVFDVELFNSGGFVMKPIRGLFSVDPECTR
jgi:hypothetical protein